MLYRLGWYLCRYRWGVLAVWAILVVASIPMAPQALSVLQTGGFTIPELEAQRASDLLSERFGYQPSPFLVLLINPSPTDPPEGFLSELDRLASGLRQLEPVASVTAPGQAPTQLSADHSTAYVVVSLRPGRLDAREFLPELQRALAQSPLESVITGTPVFYSDIYDLTEQDLRRAEIISLPFASLALILVFGSLLAAAAPGIIGGAAVIITLASLVGLSRVHDLSIFALNLVTMLSFGLGIDYSLFITSRFREEIGEGRSTQQAVARALDTAGRAVLFSGAAICVGLLALVTFRFMALRSLGLAGAVVALVTLLAALTLLPALLAILGPHIDALRVLPARMARGQAWARLANVVMRYPLPVFFATLALLLMLGAPFLRAEFGVPDASILPQGVPSRRGFDLLEQKFGAGELSPVLVVVQSDGATVAPQNLNAIYDLARRIELDPRVERVDSLVSLDPRLTRAQYQLIYGRPDRITDPYALAAFQQFVRDEVSFLRVTPRYGPTEQVTKGLVKDIRATGAAMGLEVQVGGLTAGILDYTTELYREFPRALAFVVVSTYLLLVVLFRSLVLPLKAVIMDVLSITAAYGALVIVFQEGFLSGPLGFKPLGFVEASLPILLFCVLFGLSMDYEVFLLSRVREAYLKSGDNAGSVAAGLQRSGGIITGAAAIIVLVSGSFVAADIVIIKALGLGTALAVLVDATVVRALLVPATMKMLGSTNWWLPAPLERWLPRWDLRE